MNGFKGPDGRQRLVGELLKQSILREDREAATVIAEKRTIAEYSARSSIFREGDTSHYMLPILDGHVWPPCMGTKLRKAVQDSMSGKWRLSTPMPPDRLPSLRLKTP